MVNYMNMKKLFDDFKSHINSMTDDDIKKSIDNAVKHSENDENDYREPSVCDDCEIGDGWECQFCCSKCYEDYGECPNPDCDPMDI